MVPKRCVSTRAFRKQPQALLVVEHGVLELPLPITIQSLTALPEHSTAKVTVQLRVATYKWKSSYGYFTNYEEIAPTLQRDWHSTKLSHLARKGVLNVTCLLPLTSSPGSSEVSGGLYGDSERDWSRGQTDWRQQGHSWSSWYHLRPSFKLL